MGENRESHQRGNPMGLESPETRGDEPEPSKLLRLCGEDGLAEKIKQTSRPRTMLCSDIKKKIAKERGSNPSCPVRLAALV